MHNKIWNKRGANILKLDDFKNIEEMKRTLINSVENATSEDIKKNPFFDLSNSEKIDFKLTKEIIKKHNLEEWLSEYKKEAKVSTGGIRGVQNILYPWDTRFPIHQIGVALATIAKVMVLKEEIKNRQIEKVLACEVRYNSKSYVELISRIQAAMGVKTHLFKKNIVTTVWLASFSIFTNDFDGGEYVTSSHSISRKIATKDLDNQGSQFLPEMSLRFVAKIEEILKQAKEKEEGFTIRLSEKNHPLIVRDIDETDKYVSYLKEDIASKKIINEINNANSLGFKTIIDCVGGSFYTTAKEIFEKLNIDETIIWCNTEEDPFFHGTGKVLIKKNKIKSLVDLSCDVTIKDVAKSMCYDKILENKPVGTPILIVDPDADRLITFQIEPRERIEKLRYLGIDFIDINKEKVCAMYTPNQSFLFNMDYYLFLLKKSGFLKNHPRFIIKTTASAIYWNSWAQKNNIKTIETPVGFKELASIMKKVEKEIQNHPAENIIITDIYGNKINLGKNPRVLFAGEESGGMITGPNEFIKSNKGRKAIAMREKSAGETSVLEISLLAKLFLENRFLSDYFEELIHSDEIYEDYDAREDIILYNENESDPKKLKKQKKDGEILRDDIDSYFLSICFAIEEKIIDIETAKKILKCTFKSLNFSDLTTIKFCGDGTVINFPTKNIEIRKSGTDAKLRIYGNGENKEEIYLILNEISKFKGEKNSTFKKYIGDEYSKNVTEKARKKYFKYEENF